MVPALEVQSLNHWTALGVPIYPRDFLEEITFPFRSPQSIE